MDSTYEQLHTNPDIYTINVPFQNVSFSGTNCFVIVSGDESLIIDPGAAGSTGLEVLLNALEEIGVNLETSSVFLTHLHLDHAGLVSRFLPSGATVYLNRTDYETTLPENAGSLSDSVCSRLLAEGILETEVREFARWYKSYDYFDVSRYSLAFTEDNDVISVGEHDFRVIGTPGHTTGHQSLFHEESGIFFAGDHVLAVISPGIELSSVDTDPYQTNLDSLKRTRAMPIKRLLYAHGELGGDFNGRIDWLIEHLGDRRIETLAIIRDNPGLSGYQVIQAITWNVPYANWEDIPVPQRGAILAEGATVLDSIIALGDVERREDADGLRRYYAK
jgi:glyoxylase-like metal-dependent hydrolase (beta-lactamase superfamily II)